MPDALLILAVALSLVACILLIILLVRRPPVAEPVDLAEPLARLQSLIDLQTRLERTVAEQLATARKESAEGHAGVRQEVGARLTTFGEAATQSSRQLREEVQVSTQQFSTAASSSISQLAKQMSDRLTAFGTQLKDATDSLDKRAAELRASVEERLKQLQSDNTQKLDEMRKTVDEKLQGTLERRLSESFKQVSDRLEQVHKGLGEMQALSSGVTDLRRVMSNVKTRGTWGEWQLAALLEQLLTPDQYEKNFRARERSSELVEFAIKLPGPDDGEPVWLPIDSKFPVEDYHRLAAAAEAGDADAVAEAGAALEATIKKSARDISDKYLNPPRTTDYGVLFLPTESLFAEVLRRPGLCETLHRDCRVTVCGPTTLSMLVNSLQMGFRTMAIQKRSGEVFKLLGVVKVQHQAFGDLIEGVQKKLEEASNKLGAVAKKSAQIGRKLKDVETTPGLPVAEPGTEVVVRPASELLPE